MHPVRKSIALLMAVVLVAVMLPTTVTASGNAPAEIVCNVDDLVGSNYTDTDAGRDITGVTLPKGYDRYVINYGTATHPYLVSTETMAYLSETSATVTGTGYVKDADHAKQGGWQKYSASQLQRAGKTGTVYSKNATQGTYQGANLFTGAVPADKLNDPLYTAVNRVGDAYYYLASGAGTGRVAAGNLFPGAQETFKYVRANGSVYLKDGAQIADDATVTLCIGEIHLLYYKSSTGWQRAAADFVTAWPVLDGLSGGYARGQIRALHNNVTTADDGHIEIALTGADFNQTNGTNEQGYVRFWGNRLIDANLGSAGIKGVAVSYRIWVKEADMADKLVAVSGAEWRMTSTDSVTWQTFYSRAHAVTNAPSTVIGHNAGPDIYEDVMGNGSAATLWNKLNK